VLEGPPACCLTDATARAHHRAGSKKVVLLRPIKRRHADVCVMGVTTAADGRAKIVLQRLLHHQLPGRRSPRCCMDNLRHQGRADGPPWMAHHRHPKKRWIGPVGEGTGGVAGGTGQKHHSLLFHRRLPRRLARGGWILALNGKLTRHGAFRVSNPIGCAVVDATVECWSGASYAAMSRPAMEAASEGPDGGASSVYTEERWWVFQHVLGELLCTLNFVMCQCRHVPPEPLSCKWVAWVMGNGWGCILQMPVDLIRHIATPNRGPVQA